MPIEFQLPLPPRDAWAAHKKEVKRCRGTACYAAIAAHFGSDSPKILEWRIDRRTSYTTKDDDKSLSNKYLRWRQGMALPSADSVAHVLDRSKGGVRLDFWRDLPLWELMAAEPPSIRRLHAILESLHPSIRSLLFGLGGQLGQYNHSMPDRDQTLAIRNQRSLAAFIALLCLARKGETLDNDPQHFLPSACAFDLFPRILYSHPPLRYRWEGLYACLERIFWKRLYIIKMHSDYSIDAVRSNLQALDQDPSADLPRVSGKRFRVINEEADVFKQLQERIARAVSVT